MHAVLIKVVNTETYLQLVDNDRNLLDGYIQIQYIDSANLSGPDYIEWVFRYVVKDVNMKEDEVIQENIAAITDLEIELNPRKSTDDLPGEAGKPDSIKIKTLNPIP
jgi:hypothetical protein